MNVLILNGGPAGPGGDACRRLRDGLVRESSSRGWTAEALDLAGLTIRPCRGCYACWVKHPGVCAVRGDDGERVPRAMARDDVRVFLTPVTFGGFSSDLKKALDRLIPVALPFFGKYDGEIHHPDRYPRPRRLLAVGTLPRPDAEAERIFRGLIARNARNMHAVGTAAAVVSGPVGEDEARRTAAELLREAGVAS